MRLKGKCFCAVSARASVSLYPDQMQAENKGAKQKGSRWNFILYICFLPEVASRELFLCGVLGAAGTKVFSEDEVRAVGCLKIHTGETKRATFKAGHTPLKYSNSKKDFKIFLIAIMTMVKESNYSRKNVSSRTLGRIVSLPCLAYLKEG
jgi:hypothetical protein